MSLSSRPERQIPEVRDMSAESLYAQFEKEFGQHLRETGYEPDDPRGREELVYREAMQRHFSSVLLLEGQEGTTKQIQNHWQEMVRLTEERIERRGKMTSEKTIKDTGVKLQGGETLVDGLQREIHDAFPEKEHKHLAKKLEDMARAIDDTAGEHRGRYTFYKPDGIDTEAVAKAEAEILEMMNNPVTATDEQRTVLGHLLVGLRNIGSVDPRYEARRAMEMHKNAMPQSPAMRGARFAMLTVGAMLTAWALKLKNWKVAALYGGITLLAYKPDFFKGTEHHQMKDLSYLCQPTARDLLARYPGNWKPALHELYDVINHGTPEQKRLLHTLKKSHEGVSVAQARELAGDRNALFSKLAEARDNKDRRDILRAFGHVKKKDIQQLSLDFVGAKEELINAPLS